MQDKKTVIPFIQEVKEKFSCKNCIFVGDRGMVTVENLEFLERGKKELESVRSMVEKGIIRDEVKVIKRAQKKLVKSRCERFYDFTYKEGKFEIIEKREFIEKARALCGYYILKTTLVDKKEEEIEENYKQLRAVEATFRELKELVKIMPIYHWRDRRVRIHVFLCILAQQVVKR